MVADYTAQSVNAKGAISVVHLHDVPNHAREIALRGVCHGATVALAVAQSTLDMSFNFFSMVF